MKATKYFIFQFLLIATLSISALSLLGVGLNFKTDVGHFFSLNYAHGTNIVDFYQRIELDNAWNITTGSSSAFIGIVDSGIDSSYAELSNNLDYSLSYDFYSQNRGALTSINNHHGTFVARRLGGDGNLGFSYSGVSLDVNLISLRIDSNISPYNEDLTYLINAIVYATNNTIPVLNFSGGFYENEINYFQKSALRLALSVYPGLFVCAAGNGNQNTSSPEMYDIDSDGFHLYPACFDLDNILVVGGTEEDSDAVHNGMTNYGTTSVDLFAPSGEGTSLAAPLVAGTAALMLSVNPNLTAAQLKQKIMNSVDHISGYNNYCVSGGRLNVYRSVLSALPVLEEGANLSTYELEYGVDQWYQFTCDYGYYSIQTTGNVDTIGYLYSDPLGNPICSSSSGGSGNNFLISQHLSPGTYYLRVSANPYSPSAQFNIVFNNHSHLYNDYSIPAGPTKHRNYCECGASQLKPHVFPVDPNGIIMPCVVCGYSNGGLILSNLNFELESFNTDSYISKDGIVYLGPYDYNDYINNLAKGGMINE